MASRKSNTADMTAAPITVDPASLPGSRAVALPPKQTSGQMPAIPKRLTTPRQNTIPARAADMKRDYVAASLLRFFAGYLQSLPHPVDDIAADFGQDIYARMMHDPQVASTVNTLKHQALSAPLSLPCMRQDSDGDYPMACEVRDFCDRALSGMDTPLTDVLWNLLDALPYGNKVAEIVLRPGDGPDAGRLTLRAIKPKPFDVTAFVVDNYNNVIGLLAIEPGVTISGVLQRWFDDPQQVPNLLPRDKFAVLTCRAKDGDPRGQSLLRPAYNPWYLKTTIWPEYLKFLGQFGTPGLVAETSAEAIGNVALLNPDGTAQVDANGNALYGTPQQALLQVLLAYHNSAVAALPPGCKISPMQVASNGEAFDSAIDLFNREIEKGVTGQTLATSEGEHQARAASETHATVLGDTAGYARTITETMLYRDILKPLVLKNFGPGAAPLTPMPSFSDTSPGDLTPKWAAAAALQTSGYLDPSQYDKLDAALGLPARSEESIQSAIDRKNAPPAPTPSNKPATFNTDGVTWITLPGGRHIPIGDKSGGSEISTGEKTPSASVKSMLAKQSAVYVGADIQRYSEEHNEPILAAGVKGLSLRDNEPVDVIVLRKGKVTHGVELKTMVSNSNNKITMKASAMERKAGWVKEHGAPYHTVVFDDHAVFNSGGKGEHDDDKRQIYYRRGFGSFRVNAMHPVKDMAELNRLMDTPDAALPVAAKPPKTYVSPEAR